MSRSGWFWTALGVVASLAGLCISLLDSHSLLLWQKILFVPAIIFGLLALGGILRVSPRVFCFLKRLPHSGLRWLRDKVVPFWFSFLLHCDQQQAVRANPFFRVEFVRQRKLLGFLSADLSRRAHINWLAVIFFCRFPIFIPRPEYLLALETALMLPEGYFERGGSYGKKCCIDRLWHYDDMKIAEVSLKTGILRLREKDLEEVVRKIEAQISEDLLKGKVP